MSRLFCVTRCSFLICSGVLVRPHLIFSKPKGVSSHSHNYTFSGNPCPAEGAGRRWMHSLFFFRSSARKSLGASRRLFTALEEGQGDFRLAIATAGRLEELPYACLCPQVRRSMGGDSFALRSVHVQCERESFRRLGRLWKKSEGKNILWWMMCAVVHAVAARTSSETGFGKGFRFWAGRRYADRAAGTRDYRAEYP